MDAAAPETVHVVTVKLAWQPPRKPVAHRPPRHVQPARDLRRREPTRRQFEASIDDVDRMCHGEHMFARTSDGNAAERIRTSTPLSEHRHLKPGRLPVPPQPLAGATLAARGLPYG